MHWLILLCVFIPMVFIFVGGVECSVFPAWEGVIVLR